VASIAADIFRQAAARNLEDPRRTGNTVELGSGCQVIVAGDLHGNRVNFTKILSHAALGKVAGRRLVVQELLHAPPDPRTGQDRSVDMLLRAAKTKIEHPDAMLFVLGNHDIAQITGNEITKDGHAVCKSFDEGIRFAFGDDAAEVREAVYEFLRSLPLAIRCVNRVLITHSLPTPSRSELAGVEILTRPSRDEDFFRGKPIYEWTWGRGQTDEQLDQLAATLDVDFFVTAHRHVEGGHEMVGPRAIALASDHEHGSVIRFSTDTPLTGETALKCVRKIVAL